MGKLLSVTLGLAALAWVSSTFNLAGESRLESQLVGTWEANVEFGARERLVLKPVGGDGWGRFTSRQTLRGREHSFRSGLWRIRVNPLLGKNSRTQLRMVWNDRNWGRKTSDLAIRGVTERTLSLGNVYVERNVMRFHRLQ